MRKVRDPTMRSCLSLRLYMRTLTRNKKAIKHTCKRRQCVTFDDTTHEVYVQIKPVQPFLPCSWLVLLYPHPPYDPAI